MKWDEVAYGQKLNEVMPWTLLYLYVCFFGHIT